MRLDLEVMGSKRKMFRDQKGWSSGSEGIRKPGGRKVKGVRKTNAGNSRVGQVEGQESGVKA